MRLFPSVFLCASLFSATTFSGETAHAVLMPLTVKPCHG